MLGSGARPNPSGSGARLAPDRGRPGLARLRANGLASRAVERIAPGAQGRADEAGRRLGALRDGARPGPDACGRPAARARRMVRGRHGPRGAGELGEGARPLARAARFSFQAASGGGPRRGQCGVAQRRACRTLVASRSSPGGRQGVRRSRPLCRGHPLRFDRRVQVRPLGSMASSRGRTARHRALVGASVPGSLHLGRRRAPARARDSRAGIVPNGAGNAPARRPDSRLG